jgi:hypothetical protein
MGSHLKRAQHLVLNLDLSQYVDIGILSCKYADPILSAISMPHARSLRMIKKASGAQAWKKTR